MLLLEIILLAPILLAMSLIRVTGMFRLPIQVV